MHKIQQDDTVFESVNAFRLMQCYAVRLLECQYLNLSFIFIVLPFTYSVPVNLLSSLHIRLNSKRYYHTFYTLRLSLLFFKNTSKIQVLQFHGIK